MEGQSISHGAHLGIDTLVNRARLTSGVIIATLIGYGLTLLGELLELAGVINLDAIELDALAVAYSFVLLGVTAVFIVSVVFVCMWIHRAHSNLHEAGIEGLNFTPGWAVGWYFIPIANLFKPFQAMRELWTESHGVGDSYGAPSPGNLGIWWGAWIIGNILGNVSTRMTLMGDGSNMQVAIVLAAASTVCMIVSAWQLLRIVREVTEAQASGLSLAQVFE